MPFPGGRGGQQTGQAVVQRFVHLFHLLVVFREGFLTCAMCHFKGIPHLAQRGHNQLQFFFI